MKDLAADLRLRTWQLALVTGLGLGEVATGALLVVWPEAVVRLLAIAPHTTPGAVWLRWIGVFVACVGAAYLWALRGRGGARRTRLRFALEWTSGTRLAVAVFLASQVLASELDPAWCRVGAYDAVVATAQLALLAAWRGDDAR